MIAEFIVNGTKDHPLTQAPNESAGEFMARCEHIKWLMITSKAKHNKPHDVKIEYKEVNQ